MRQKTDKPISIITNKDNTKRIKCQIVSDNDVIDPDIKNKKIEIIQTALNINERIKEEA